MPSGYEQSPDYGGPEPTWKFLVAVALCLAAAAALVVWL